MTLHFAAAINGTDIRCEISSDVAIAAPIFCFSLLAPVKVLAGGTLIRSVAGYAEIALPDLLPQQSLDLILAYEDPGFRPMNRAWLPLGAYLRCATGLLPLPPLPAGVQFADAPTPQPSQTPLRLIPQPTDWQPGEGSLELGALCADHPALVRADALARRLNLPPLLDHSGHPVEVTQDPSLPAESYRLTLATKAVHITAADDAGLFYASITLINLRETHSGILPCGTITDAPRFGWRGQHLDCARHFYAPATLHKLLDLMALLKLNRFHWHFADDEAFRLEVDCAPGLWQKTAFRGEGCAVPGVFGGGIRAGGSYSKADVTALLDRAAALNIEVLPEIEVPAHAFALNKAIAGLRDNHDRSEEVSIQGYRENIINPALDATWALLEPLSLEVAGLFPFGILHLGCDELPPRAWEGSLAVEALREKHGLKDRDDVQGWMMHKLAAHLEKHGIRPAAWEEAAKGAQGGIGHGALLFSWTGQGPGVEAARRGHDVVMCPAQHLYFDMAHTDDPDDWGATWAGTTALEDTVNWLPVPEGAEDIADRIAGVEGCFWSEFTTEDQQMEPMLAPRILGLANKAWDRADSVNGAGLRSLAASYGAIFDRIGWQRHRSA